jgi:hypothetical protein
MITLNTPENSFFSGRIENFLRFKNLEYKKVYTAFSPEKKTKNLIIPPAKTDDFLVEIIFENDEKFSGTLSSIRETEERFPFPIGFIGPIESTLQWSSMIIAALPEFSKQALEPVFAEIQEKVEDEFFLMGPTFTVADCILASDLKNLQKQMGIPVFLTKYIERVEINIQSNK